MEQNLGVATSVAERVAIMVTGRIALQTSSAELLADESAGQPVQIKCTIALLPNTQRSSSR